MLVRLKLIKWTLLLCAALFSTMLVLGQDSGQRRLGLVESRNTLSTRNTVIAPAVKPAAPLEQTNVSLVFAPAMPLIAPPEKIDEPAAEQAASTSTTEPVRMFVAANRANLRAGPGKEFAVRAKLRRGQAVELVASDLGQGDWVLVRTEAARGYISSGLLTNQAP